MRKEFKVWDGQHGYWIGALSFFGADQEANEDPEWPYRYDHYTGFNRVCVRGSEFVQRNIFVYPPQTADFCTAHGYNSTSNGRTAPGGGVCGEHGNEKLWEAGPLFADDCQVPLSFVRGESRCEWTTRGGPAAVAVASLPSPLPSSGVSVRTE
eukprot:scaffold602_cov342-Prasinococcus_capsulatus_cf.AAC.19